MRLIDADILKKYFEDNSNLEQGNEWFVGNVIDAITNAPVIEQGEPVAIVHRGNAYWKGKEQPEGTKLYTAPPPQPQTVKNALEKAIQYIESTASFIPVDYDHIGLDIVAQCKSALKEVNHG